MPDAFFTSSKPRKRKRADGSSSNDRPQNNKSSRTGNTARAGNKNGHGGGSSKTFEKGKGQSKKPQRKVDEELSDDTDQDGDLDDLELRVDPDDEAALTDEEYSDEAPANKRKRLAKLFIESVTEGLADGEFDAAEIDKELISARLKQSVMEHSGKIHLFIADDYDFTQPPKTLRTRGHRFSVTSAVASESGAYLFSAGKEGSIIKWSLSDGKKLATFHKIRPETTKPTKGKGKGKAPPPNPEIKGHTDEVLALAVSGDGKYLASGGRDRRLAVWDVEKAEFMRGFIGHLGHKDAISTLAFRKGTHQLYTGSHDRTLKVYDLSPSVMGYVETLFGHQDHVLAVDALRGETCVSVGSRDKTVRYWKIVDETQLVFRGGGRSRVREVLEGEIGQDEDEHDNTNLMAVDGAPREKTQVVKKFVEGSMECVAMIDETTFLSGGDSGSICLWSTVKKKPIFTQALAHGLNDMHSATEGLIQTARWITALASLRYSDLFASGSWDGDIRLWKLDSKVKSFSLVGTVSAPGVINSLQFISPPKDFTADWTTVDDTAEPKQRKAAQNVLLVGGIGQEHRLGRWLSMKDGVVNGSVVVSLTPRTLE